jgi:hypothetical protein
MPANIVKDFLTHYLRRITFLRILFLVLTMVCVTIFNIPQKTSELCTIDIICRFHAKYSLRAHLGNIMSIFLVFYTLFITSPRRKPIYLFFSQICLLLVTFHMFFNLFYFYQAPRAIFTKEGDFKYLCISYVRDHLTDSFVVLNVKTNDTYIKTILDNFNSTLGPSNYYSAKIFIFTDTSYSGKSFPNSYYVFPPHQDYEIVELYKIGDCNIHCKKVRLKHQEEFNELVYSNIFSFIIFFVTMILVSS